MFVKKGKRFFVLSALLFGGFVTYCVRNDTNPPKITTVLTRHRVWRQVIDASVTETRINWTRWKAALNFKLLNHTSNANHLNWWSRDLKR